MASEQTKRRLAKDASAFEEVLAKRFRLDFPFTQKEAMCLAQAALEILPVERLATLKAIVDKQAGDDGLWFEAQTAPEAYLQQELRKLHKSIEGGQVVSAGVYESAVKGRQDFRKAYRDEREYALQLEAALQGCLAAMNPEDRSGISLHEWNKRLKAATKLAESTRATRTKALENTQ